MGQKLVYRKDGKLKKNPINKTAFFSMLPGTTKDWCEVVLRQSETYANVILKREPVKIRPFINCDVYIFTAMAALYHVVSNARVGFAYGMMSLRSKQQVMAEFHA